MRWLALIIFLAGAFCGAALHQEAIDHDTRRGIELVEAAQIQMERGDVDGARARLHRAFETFQSVTRQEAAAR